MPQRNIVEAINNALAEEMESDPRVMLLGLDVGKLGGVFRTTSGLVERFGTDRVVDTPLAEASIIGASLGLALAGMVPVAEIQFLGFTAQGFHQLGPQLGKYRQRSRGRYHCQVTVRAPFGGGIRSPEFHSDAIEAQFVQSPGIKIVMPSNSYDAKGLLIEAIRDPDPVLYCEPDRLYRAGRSEVPDGPYTVPFGKAAVVREGQDVTLVAWSAAVELCLRAAEALAAEGDADGGGLLRPGRARGASRRLRRSVSGRLAGGLLPAVYGPRARRGSPHDAELTFRARPRSPLPWPRPRGRRDRRRRGPRRRGPSICRR